MRISKQIFPRCVVLITSVNKEGKPNVMTASFVMPISFEPKYVAFSVAETRHTFRNIKEIPEFGFNILSEDMRKEAEICGSHSGYNTDKFKLAELEIENSKKIKPPLIKNCPISFECVIEEMKRFGDHYLVVGKVVREVVRKEEFKPLLHKSGGEFPKIE